MRKYILTRILPLGALYTICTVVLSYWVWWKLTSPIAVMISTNFEVIQFIILLAILSGYAVLSGHFIRQSSKLGVAVSHNVVYVGVFIIGILICLMHMSARFKSIDITDSTATQLLEAGIVKIVVFTIVMLVECLVVSMMCKWWLNKRPMNI